MGAACWVLVLVGLMLALVQGLRMGLGVSRMRIVRLRSSTPSFDANEADQVLGEVTATLGKQIPTSNEDTYNALKSHHEAQSEELFRKYPFEHYQLPVLRDRDNYYSGKLGDYFWHQNADQVLVYIPIDETIRKSDIKAKFEARRVTIMCRNTELVSFPCSDRIIPEGSFWVIESSETGKRFIQLDLEKRHRMLNWKGLFRAPVENETMDQEERAKLLRQLLAANAGMSKLTGIAPESLQEMMNNPDFKKMLSDVVEEKPQISFETDDGTMITPDAEYSDVFQRLEPLKLSDMTEDSADAHVIDSELM